MLAITGAHEYEQVVGAVHDAAPAPRSPYLDLVPGGAIEMADLKLTPRHYSYLKISEGCNHRCAFCIIPSLRGDLVSRRPDAILREAEKLVAAGTKELLVISQDTSAYGIDIRREPRLWKGREVVPDMTDLARELGRIAPWVRLHYVYPYPHVDRVIPLMAEGLVLPYLDIPFQHASPAVLRRMKRPANDAKVLERIRGWRDICPDIAIRSTFVLGFPGETEEDVEYLLDWLDEAQLDRVGAFRFEPVAGASANDLPDHVPEELKEERYARVMEKTAAISAAKLQGKIGRTLNVIIDAVDARAAARRDALRRRAGDRRRGPPARRRVSRRGGYRGGDSRGCRRPRPVRRTGCYRKRRLTGAGALVIAAPRFEPLRMAE